MELTDRQLVEKILSGERKSLTYFYNHLKPRLHNFISLKVGNFHDSEEITQDVFMASLDALRDFSFKCSLYTFICSIAKHKIIDYYRKKKIKTIVFSQIPEGLTPLISQFLGPEEEFNIVEVRGQITEVFRRLKPKYAYILKLKYIEGLSINHIAEKLLTSIKSVESMLFRARIAFAKEYRFLYA